jgi:hypothetical protein
MEILNKYAAGLPNLMRWIRAAFASGEKLGYAGRPWKDARTTEKPL